MFKFEIEAFEGAADATLTGRDKVRAVRDAINGAVAAKLENGEAVALDTAKLAQAMRSSGDPMLSTVSGENVIGALRAIAAKFGRVHEARMSVRRSIGAVYVISRS